MVSVAVLPASWRFLHTPQTAFAYWRRSVALRDGKILTTTDKDAALFPNGETRGAATGPMAQLRMHHTLVALADGRALAIGGLADWKTPPLGSCELFDPASATWRPGPSLGTARASHATVAVGDRILVIGGSDISGKPLDSVEAWTPGDAEWTTLPSLTRPRSEPQAVTLADGSVLVVDGGVERWDPATEAWSLLPEGPARTLVAVAALRAGGAVLAGGRDGTSDVKNVDVLAADGTWRRGADLPESRQGAAAVELEDGRIAIVGGSGTRSVTEDSGTGGELDYEYRSFTTTWVDRLESLEDVLTGTVDGPWAWQPGMEIAGPRAAHLGANRLLITGARVSVLWDATRSP